VRLNEGGTKYRVLEIQNYEGSVPLAQITWVFLEMLRDCYSCGRSLSLSEKKSARMIQQTLIDLYSKTHYYTGPRNHLIYYRVFNGRYVRILNLGETIPKALFQNAWCKNCLTPGSKDGNCSSSLEHGWYAYDDTEMDFNPILWQMTQWFWDVPSSRLKAEKVIRYLLQMAAHLDGVIHLPSFVERLNSFSLKNRMMGIHAWALLKEKCEQREETLSCVHEISKRPIFNFFSKRDFQTQFPDRPLPQQSLNVLPLQEGGFLMTVKGYFVSTDEIIKQVAKRQA
jgi:hypothetical protein